MRAKLIPDDMPEQKKPSSGKLAAHHTQTLEHRRNRLAAEPVLARELDDELKAITWAIDMLRRIQWRRTADALPKPGTTVYTTSNVAGLGVAVFMGDRGFICTCGCEQTIPDVTAWTNGPPTPGPSWGPRDK